MYWDTIANVYQKLQYFNIIILCYIKMNHLDINKVDQIFNSQRQRVIGWVEVTLGVFNTVLIIPINYLSYILKDPLEHPHFRFYQLVKYSHYILIEQIPQLITILIFGEKYLSNYFQMFGCLNFINQSKFQIGPFLTIKQTKIKINIR